VTPLRAHRARASLALLSGDAIARLLLFGTGALASWAGVVGLVSFVQALPGYFLLAGDWGLSTYGARAGRPPARAGPEAWRLWERVLIEAYRRSRARGDRGGSPIRVRGCGGAHAPPGSMPCPSGPRADWVA
jgi:hypothetical protein